MSKSEQQNVRLSKKRKLEKGQPESDRLGSHYLEHIKVTSFGRFANVIVGPLAPGMNVIYGPNEAGKTTVNELVKGVLFGWPANRGAANPYKPEAAERAGSLFFKDCAAGNVLELKRVKNTDDMPEADVVLSDIDQETYETMFALTSDELLRLDKHNEVTARLLTAGAGTSSSPAHALEEITGRVKDAMSKSAQNPDSVINLKAELARLRAQVRVAEEEANMLLAQEKKMAALKPRRDTLARTQESLNEEIENLKAAHAKVALLDDSVTQLRADLDAAQRAQATYTTGEGEIPDDVLPLVYLSQAEEYRLRDALDDLDEQRMKLEHLAENARREAMKSQAEYDVLTQDEDTQERHARALVQRRFQLASAIVVPLLMAALGAYSFMIGYTAHSLSYSLAGIGIILFACTVAAAGIAMSMKPSKVEEELSEAQKKCAWVLQQDQKTLEACERDVERHRAHIASYLAANGLAAAQGSLRRARRLLDRAVEARSSLDLADQNRRALALQRSSLEASLAEAVQQRSDLCHSLGLHSDAPAEEIEELIARKTEERTQTAQLALDTENQYGELKQQLLAARRATAFDEAKQQAEVVAARSLEARTGLARLLIAQHALEVAIAEWERKSQPEVYAQASRLLSLMTQGAWQQVRMNAKGELEVVDAVKTARPPHLLSLGTRQQLYLSLRIALLMTATNVGRNLPIMCDDILVNFDAQRRRAAATALVELARKRQVILFTCHSEIASLVESIDPTSNLLEL